MPWATRKNNIGMMKIVLYFINALLIFGSLLIIWHLYEFSEVFPAGYICYVIPLPTLMIICAILGIIGLRRENLRLTQVYGVIFLVILLIQILDMFVAKTFMETITQISRNNVNAKWNEEIKHQGAMDELQTKFKCCGNNSFYDYAIVLNRPGLPKSCYHLNSTIALNSTEPIIFQKEGTDKSITDPTSFGQRAGGKLNTTLSTNQTYFGQGNATFYAEGCFTGAEKTVFKSFAVDLRANLAAMAFGFILLSWIYVIWKHFTNEKRRRNFPNTI